MRRIALLLLLGPLAASACGSPSSAAASAAGPPVSVLLERMDTVPLDTQLVWLSGMTNRALDQDASARAGTVSRIEALTDGLIEARLPFRRLASGYSLESRLRQMQALADRIVAEQEVGSMGDSVRADLRRLHLRLDDLRVELRLPGQAAPPPIDSLLNAWNRTHGPSLSPLVKKPKRATTQQTGTTTQQSADTAAARPPDTTRRPVAADTIP